jgi:hypothetical protein
VRGRGKLAAVARALENRHRAECRSTDRVERNEKHSVAIHSAPPNGWPRFPQRRSASDSASVCGSLTDSSHRLGSGVGLPPSRSGATCVSPVVSDLSTCPRFPSRVQINLRHRIVGQRFFCGEFADVRTGQLVEDHGRQIIELRPLVLFRRRIATP